VSTWKEYLERLRSRAKQAAAERDDRIAQQREEIETLTATVSDLRATIRDGFASAPDVDTQKWLNGQHVLEAEQERDHAYRLRDYAMRTLLAVDQIHHPTEHAVDMCSCGKPVRDCLVGKELEPEREHLYKWENKQIERARKGHSNFLPESHKDHDSRTRVY